MGNYARNHKHAQLTLAAINTLLRLALTATSWISMDTGTMTQSANFYGLQLAATLLSTDEDGLLKLATEGKITLSISTPPSVEVWAIKNRFVNSLGDYSIEKAAHIKSLDIGTEDCLHLLTNLKRTISPLYTGGCSVTPSRETLRHTKIKQLPTKLSLHVQPERYGPKPLPTGPGDLLTLKDGKFEYLTIRKDDLGVTGIEFIRFQGSLLDLPADEMKTHKNTTTLMKDMNLAARRMFAMAFKNNGLYPETSTVIDFLDKCTSFVEWRKNQPEADKGKYKDLSETAALLIKPTEARGKGRRKIDSSKGYLSEDFRLLIQASTKYWAKIETDSPYPEAPTVTEVTSWLKQNGMSMNIATRCAPLIWPTPIKKGAPITLDPSEQKKKRTRKKKSALEEHTLHTDI